MVTLAWKWFNCYFLHFYEMSRERYMMIIVFVIVAILPGNVALLSLLNTALTDQQCEKRPPCLHS